jgi:hypothetical protein
MERLVGTRAEWFNQLKPDSVAALRQAIRRGMERGAEGVRRRLQEPDLWLHPTIEHARGPTEQLDDPNHRAWVAILNGADALDPVLTEFGLPPSVVPDPGGGHYGLQPQRLGDLATNPNDVEPGSDLRRRTASHSVEPSLLLGSELAGTLGDVRDDRSSRSVDLVSDMAPTRR